MKALTIPKPKRENPERERRENDRLARIDAIAQNRGIWLVAIFAKFFGEMPRRRKFHADLAALHCVGMQSGRSFDEALFSYTERLRARWAHEKRIWEGEQLQAARQAWFETSDNGAEFPVSDEMENDNSEILRRLVRDASAGTPDEMPTLFRPTLTEMETL